MAEFYCNPKNGGIGAIRQHAKLRVEQELQRRQEQKQLEKVQQQRQVQEREQQQRKWPFFFGGSFFYIELTLSYVF